MLPSRAVRTEPVTGVQRSEIVNGTWYRARFAIQDPGADDFTVEQAAGESIYMSLVTVDAGRSARTAR